MQSPRILILSVVSLLGWTVACGSAPAAGGYGSAGLTGDGAASPAPKVGLDKAETEGAPSEPRTDPDGSTSRGGKKTKPASEDTDDDDEDDDADDADDECDDEADDADDDDADDDDDDDDDDGDDD